MTCRASLRIREQSERVSSSDSERCVFTSGGIKQNESKTDAMCLPSVLVLHIFFIVKQRSMKKAQRRRVFLFFLCIVELRAMASAFSTHVYGSLTSRLSGMQQWNRFPFVDRLQAYH